jgi:fido (protein-threonine AMPylation protein)
MHPQDCPVFEYSQHPDRALILPRATQLIRDLRTRAVDSPALATDSRAVHENLFRGLTPPQCDYYAGHYRGENFRCLRFYRVHIPGDPRVGYNPEIVVLAMGAIATEIHSGLAALDLAHAVPNARLSPADKLRYTVTFASRLLVWVLGVHPYANGNGHAARFIVWAILGRYGYWPYRWPIEPRPPDPPYSELIYDYRSGNPEPLEKYLLQNIG